VPVSNDTNVVLAPLQVYDLASQTATTLLTADSLRGHNTNNQPAQFLLPAAWTNDSRWLLVVAAGENFAGLLVAVPAAGEERVIVLSTQEGFSTPLLSPDSRYLAFLEAGQTPANTTLRLLDLERVLGGEPASFVSAAVGVTSAAWSPDGRLIALAGPGGLRVLEAASGEMRWVTLQACQGVLWPARGR
jgi:hypothetical protein